MFVLNTCLVVGGFFSTAQEWYYIISLLRPNQQTIILGTPKLYRTSCISSYSLKTQSSEWAVEYVGNFFKCVCLREM